ncbi:MAG: phenylacetate--CoA ligase family protein [Candidatus Micrarchaeia archaeon]
MLKEVFIQRVVDPFFWKLLKGSNRYQYYLSMEKKQWQPLEQNRQEQAKKLFQIISYAEKNIPYYKKMIRDNELSYSEETIFSDILKFPILTKEIIKDNSSDLTNPSMQGVLDSSGGSTGEPITIMHGKKALDYIAATKTLCKSWAGRKPGELIIKLWGSDRDIMQGGQGINGVLVEAATNTILLNTFRMSESDMEGYIQLINKKHPKLIVAYVQSAYEIARFALENNIHISPPSGIMVSAGTLYPHFREEIQKAFGCPVFNRYGCREVGDIAFDCDKHEGLHLNTFHHYLEILDEDLIPIQKEGEKGEVYVTTLNEFKMPLIRYKVGDIATFTSHACSCGRGLPILKAVHGRDVDLFINFNGELIDGEYFTHLFYFSDWVKQFQLVQKTVDFIEIKVVKRKEENKEDIANITDKIKLVMGKDCVISWIFVEEISVSKSGKYRYTISLVK